jgi:hypothetical protein
VSSLAVAGTNHSVTPPDDDDGLARGKVAERDDVNRERERADHIDLPPMEADQVADADDRPSEDNSEHTRWGDTAYGSAIE